MKLVIDKKLKRLGVAVSGGVDSMVLLHLLLRDFCGELFVINIDHNLRAESGADTEFVRGFCKAQGLKFRAFSVDVKAHCKASGVSLELGARELRYRAFEEARKEFKLDAIATAHHADDNAETVMFRILRGTGVAGLRGIGEREGFVRPLLAFSKAEIEAYARDNRVPFVVDKTNAETDYTRNFLRLEVLPKIEERFPAYREALARLTASAVEAQEAIDYFALRAMGDGDTYILPKSAFIAPLAIAKRSVTAVMSAMGAGDLTEAVHLNAIIDLANSRKGSRLDLPCGITVFNEEVVLKFCKKTLVTPTLRALAKHFPVPLYVVGGAVRDWLLGYAGADIDLASSASSDEVMRFLEGTEFKVHTTNKKLGTLRIVTHGAEFEYTAFRTDSYDMRGTHEPVEVKFTDDIEVDARRRDLRINAIYYDILGDKYVDPTGGQADLKAGVVHTTRVPSEVFREDALRMLRAVRLSNALGLTLSSEVVKGIAENATSLAGVSRERVWDELSKIIVSDTKYGKSEAHTKAIAQLIDTGLMKYIVPEITEVPKLFSKVKPIVRLPALMSKVPEAVLGKRLGSLKLPKSIASDTERLVTLLPTDFAGTEELELRRLIQKNHDIIDKLIQLIGADGRLSQTYEKMRADGIPFTAKGLLIRGEDLEEVPPAQRGKAISALLSKAVDGSLKTKETQKEFIANFLKRNCD